MRKCFDCFEKLSKKSLRLMDCGAGKSMRTLSIPLLLTSLSHCEFINKLEELRMRMGREEEGFMIFEWPSMVPLPRLCLSFDRLS